MQAWRGCSFRLTAVLASCVGQFSSNSWVNVHGAGMTKAAVTCLGDMTKQLLLKARTKREERAQIQLAQLFGVTANECCMACFITRVMDETCYNFDLSALPRQLTGICKQRETLFWSAAAALSRGAYARHLVSTCSCDLVVTAKQAENKAGIKKIRGCWCTVHAREGS